MDILREVREVFYANTGLSISFRFRGEQDTSDFYPPWERNEYCKLIQSTSLGRKRCRMSDRKGNTRAGEEGSIQAYQCHAGLIDAVIPLWQEKIKIGAVYTGQVVTEPPSTEMFEQIYKNIRDLELDYCKVKKAFFKVKHIPPGTLHQNLRFLSLITNYVVAAEHELKLRRENEQLQKRLRGLTISVLAHERLQVSESQLEPSGDPHMHTVEKAQIFMQENYKSRISLAEVAEAVHISPSYFSRLFKKVTGLPFSAYLTEVRIQAAKEMLSESSRPIKVIAREAGFSDYNYFNRIFKRYTGLPPGRYRNIKAPASTQY